jgi:topoisomerase IV subunit B
MCTTHADGYLTVTDNGRGIPVDPHPKFKDMSALEVIMTTLHAGGKFDSGAYETSGGLHGVGVSVVNALSDHVIVEVARGQQLYRQEFRRGKPTPSSKTSARSHRRGTKVSFHPDEQIFGKGNTTFLAARLYKMARSKSYLFGGVEIRWSCDPSLIKDKDTPEKAVLHFPGGLKDFLAERNLRPDARHQRDLLRPRRKGRQPRHGGMGRRLVRRRGRLLVVLLQHHPHARRRHA